MGAGSDELSLDIATIYEDMGHDHDAYWEYSKVKDSNNFETRATACEQMDDLMWARNKSLPSPYFADLNTTAGFQSLADVAYIEMKGRIGVSYDQVELYLFAMYNRDNQSGIIGGYPEEYFENTAIVGAGLQAQLITDQNLYFFAEAGHAKQLEELGYPDYQSDYRAGFFYYQNWNTDYDCRSQDRYPNRFILKTYAELTYYSRYDDAVWFNARVRPGIRVYESPQAYVDTYLLLSVNANLDNKDDNYNKAGLGIEWIPDRQRDFSITLEAAETYYETGGSDTSVNLEFEHYINW